MGKKKLRTVQSQQTVQREESPWLLTSSIMWTVNKSKGSANYRLYSLKARRWKFYWGEQGEECWEEQDEVPTYPNCL